MHLINKNLERLLSTKTCGLLAKIKTFLRPYGSYQELKWSPNPKKANSKGQGINKSQWRLLCGKRKELINMKRRVIPTYLVDFNVSSVNWHKLLFSMKVTITLCYRLKTSIKPWESRRTATQRGWERKRKGSKVGMRQAKLMWERKGRIRRKEGESAAKC